MSRRSRTWAMLGIIWALAIAPARAQDAALRDRVQQLVGRLETGADEDRARAEESLIKLGARVIPFLPEADKASSEAVRKRLDRIRAAVESQREAPKLEASTVTLSGAGIRLSEVLQALQKQTGNRLTDLREQMGQEVANPALELDLKAVPFFQALDVVATRAKLDINPYTGDGTIGLMAGAEEMENQQEEAATKPDPRVVYGGPFRADLKDFIIKRDFTTGISAANARIELAWEPRLRPLLVRIDLGKVRVRDDHDKAVAPSVADASLKVPVRPENPVVEINLNMAPPERAATRLATLHLEGEAVLPGRTRAFRFPALDKPAKQTEGDTTVELVSTEVDEFVWKVRLLVQAPVHGEELESYEQGLMNNRVWLQKADGSRYELNGGFSNLGSDEGKTGFEYLFVDAPGKPADYSLVYEATSELVSLPIDIEFKDIPLP